MSRVIAATNFGAVGPLNMVTLTGGVEGYLPTILSSKGELAAEAAGGTSATVIPSPIMASTPGLAAALRAEPTIQQVLKQAAEVEHAVVGVGTPTADATIVHIGYLNPDDARELRERGVVGDILGQFFDAHGQLVELPIHDRRIGIDLADLARHPQGGRRGGRDAQGRGDPRRAARRVPRRAGHQRAGRDTPPRAGAGRRGGPFVTRPGLASCGIVPTWSILG